MKVLIMCELAVKCELVESDVVPRVGDQVDMFFHPAPIVSRVLWWPNKERQEQMGITYAADVMVVVE